MSFSGGKGSIFDQVNRFFTNGNNVPVKEELKDQNQQLEKQPHHASHFSPSHPGQVQENFGMDHGHMEMHGANQKFSMAMDERAKEGHPDFSFNLQDGSNSHTPTFNEQELLKNSNFQNQQHNSQSGLNDQLLNYFSSSDGKIPEASANINDYLDSFDMGMKGIVSPAAFSNGEFNISMLNQMSPHDSDRLNQYANSSNNDENTDNVVNNITPVTSNKNLAATTSAHKQTRKHSAEMGKYSPGISPTVEAMQSPQFTPYLQARKNRFASVTTNSKKVVKHSPNLKPSPLEKRSSYKVILPSSNSPMMLPSSVVNNNGLPKLNTSGKISGSEENTSPQSDLFSKSNGDTTLAPIRSNSSISKLKDDKKILRATQSPVIRPLKKKASLSNIQAIPQTVPGEFQLDGKGTSSGLQKTHSNVIYNKNVHDVYSPKSGPIQTDTGMEQKALGRNFFQDGEREPTTGGGKTKKKEVHKEAEKNRRERLNFALEDLNDLIPKEIKSSDKFPSKATTVEHAAEYIRYLVTELVKRNIEIDLTVPSETFVPRERKASG